MSYNEQNRAKLTKAFEDFLRAVNRSAGRYPELLDTPVKAANMWLDDLLDGYTWDPSQILGDGLPAKKNSAMVVIKDLHFHAVSPKYLLPFHGIAHIGYIPRDRIAGFSKISRLLDCFSHRLTQQEEIASEICNALTEHLGVKGAACVIDSEQFSMIVRGVRKPGSRAITANYNGIMATESSIRAEFLTIIASEEVLVTQ